MCKDWQKSYSIQIIATGPNLNRIQIPLFGKHKVELNGLYFANSDNGAHVYNIVQLYSPQFRLKCSSGGDDINSNDLLSSSFPVFISNQENQIGGLEGDIGWVYDFQGTIELQLKGLAGSIAAGDVCIINLRVSPIQD
jgi:hypothetical protein